MHAFDLHQPHRDMEWWVGRWSRPTAPGSRHRSHLNWNDLHSDAVRDDFAELLAPTAQVPADRRVLGTSPTSLRREHSPATRRRWPPWRWVRRPARLRAGHHRRAHLGHRGVGRRRKGSARTSPTWLWPSSGPWASRPGTARGTCTPTPRPGSGPTLDGESHAWIEVWTGEWQALDPTIGSPVGDRHVAGGPGPGLLPTCHL